MQNNLDSGTNSKQKQITAGVRPRTNRFNRQSRMDNFNQSTARLQGGRQEAQILNQFPLLLQIDCKKQFKHLTN